MSADILCRLDRGSVELPLFSSLVSAGFPSPAQDYVERHISLDELLKLETPHVYLVRVTGDSMIGAGIFDGDLLIVDRDLAPCHGDVIVAAVDGEALVKRFCLSGSRVILHAENPSYPSRSIMEEDEFSIWGVVTASLRRHRLSV